MTFWWIYICIICIIYASYIIYIIYNIYIIYVYVYIYSGHKWSTISGYKWSTTHRVLKPQLKPCQDKMGVLYM